MGAVKNIILGLLVINTIGSTLLVPFIYLDFNLRREYIAEVLCINREEPVTVCNGKCYLTSLLGKATGQQEKERSTPPNQSNYSFYLEVNQPYTFKKHYFLQDQSNAAYNAGRGILLIEDIFHPPRQV